MKATIYTRTGDLGQTGLANGERLPKTAARIQVLGDIDELNCQIGVLNAQLELDQPHQQLLQSQSLLFELGAELASPDSAYLCAKDVRQLEQQIDNYSAELPALQHFILPSGSPSISHSHLSRAVCRRAERSLWMLAQYENLNQYSLQYLNRLSDYLFILARYIGKHSQIEEQKWQMPPNK